MTIAEYLLVILIAAGWLASVVWFKKYSKRKITEANRVEEYEQARARASVFLYPLIGLLLIAVMLWSLPNVPPGNEPFVAIFIGMGVISILYGLFKWYRLRR